MSVSKHARIVENLTRLAVFVKDRIYMSVKEVNDVTPAPVLTAEVFVVPVSPSTYMVYAPLRRAAFLANPRVVNMLNDIRDGQYDPQTDPNGATLEFLRRLSIVDGEPEQRPITTFRGEPLPTNVTLFLTTACNLRCTYCYASAGDTPRRAMSFEVAKRGIDFVSGNAVRKGTGHFDVAYHGGGEPTANWRVLTGSWQYAADRAADSGLTFSAAAASNGVLTDDQIDWMVTHLSGGVSVSFDGLPQVHDRHRLTIDGAGSSERVMHTLRRFDAAKYPYGIRVTVTHDQIACLPDSIEFICTRFRPTRIQVEPAYQLGRWAEAPSAETAEFIAAFRASQDRARTHRHEIMFSGARLDALTNHFCGVTQDSFALSPDGNVSGCYEAFAETSPLADVFFYGQPDEVSSGYCFNLPVLNHLREQSVEHREYCRDCFAKWHCAGDCYHKSLVVNGRGEFAGSDRCHISRELTRDQLLDRILSAGGYFWHEPRVEQHASRPQGKEILI